MTTSHTTSAIDALGGFLVNGTTVIDSSGNIKGTISTTTGEIDTLNVGASGTTGTLKVFPTTASKGNITITAVANSGNTATTITNAAMGQASVISMPDPGAATANFLLDAGANNNLTDLQCLIGIQGVIAKSAGTWTATRIAAGDYSLRHTAAAETVILAIDITEYIRTTASKGFKLTGIDVISKVATVALTSATPTLSSVVYANNVANAVTTITTTGSLSTATQTNPYVDTLTVSSPAFLNTEDSKIVLEISYVFQATTAFDFYGINLKFTNTIA